MTIRIAWAGRTVAISLWICRPVGRRVHWSLPHRAHRSQTHLSWSTQRSAALTRGDVPIRHPIAGFGPPSRPPCSAHGVDRSLSSCVMCGGWGMQLGAAADPCRMRSSLLQNGRQRVVPSRLTLPLMALLVVPGVRWTVSLAALLLPFGVPASQIGQRASRQPGVGYFGSWPRSVIAGLERGGLI